MIKASPTYYKPLRSPGLSPNQDLKDVALDMVFGRKIKELRSQFLNHIFELFVGGTYKYFENDFYIFFRGKRACSEENFYQMGEFSPIPNQLPCCRSLH